MTTKWKELGIKLDSELEIFGKIKIKNQKETKLGGGRGECQHTGSSSSGFLPIPGEVNLSDVILERKVAQELLFWKPRG